MRVRKLIVEMQDLCNRGFKYVRLDKGEYTILYNPMCKYLIKI